jgi:hypothetical protein
MKNLKSFKSFINENEKSNSIVFDFFPFDQNPEIEKPSVSLDSVDGINPGDLKEGLYIAHVPEKTGGFTRYVLQSLEPATFDASVWNSKMEKKQDVPGLKIEDLGNYLYTATDYGLI